MIGRSASLRDYLRIKAAFARLQSTIIATSIGFDSRGRDRFDWDAGPTFDLAADDALISPPFDCITSTGARTSHSASAPRSRSR